MTDHTPEQEVSLMEFVERQANRDAIVGSIMLAVALTAGFLGGHAVGYSEGLEAGSQKSMHQIGQPSIGLQRDRTN